jgi:RHS repeat-associated protein
MMPASKHGDPQLGVDIHLCIVPPGVPTPLPTPHISVVFDPFDYVPVLGTTITVCGMKRATAGTSGISVHIPPGFPFAKPPDKDDELFMGSSTVQADGDPFSYIALPVLSCQVAGMMSPIRLKKKGGPRIGVLPLTFNLAIPTNVFIGGAPTISLMGLAFKGAFAGLGKLAKSGVFKRLRQKLFKNLKPGFLKCSILRAEPVNILNGEVSVEQSDFSLPGRLPIEWVRSYGSAQPHVGLCGPGWQTPADIRLETQDDGSVLLLGPQVGPLSFERLPQAPGDAAVELELADGARLSDHGHEWRVLTKDDRVYHFPKTWTTPAGATPVSHIADRCGNRLTFHHRDGRPVAIEDPAGRRLVLAYTATPQGPRLAAVTLVDSATHAEHGFVRYEYDAAGDLVAVIDALGAPYRFAYEQHRMLRHTDRNGLSFHYAYEHAGGATADPADPGNWRVVHAWGDGGLYDYRFEYTDALNERRITDSLGHVSLVKLDERGLPISEIDPLGGQTIYQYDEAGRTTAVTDPDGHCTAYEYDERGNLLKLTRPDGTAIATAYSHDDKATAITDPNGATWQQAWDERGLLVQQVSPLQHTSRYAYDGLGQLVEHVNPRGARTRLGYDGAGHLAALTDALGHETRFTHDMQGNLLARGDPPHDSPGRQTQYRYDAKGRLTGVTLPSGSTIACAYDAEDNLTEYTDENGATTRLQYFGQGEVARRLQPDGHAVEYLYDTEERLIGVRNQRGELYELQRDALGRIVQETDYWGQARQYHYTAGGHLRQSIDPLGRAIAYATDPLGRIVKKTLPHPQGGARPWEESFAYDANGNLTAAANAHGQLQRQFDVQGRLTQEVQQHAAGQSFTVHNRYDEAGNRVERRTESTDGTDGTTPGPGHVVQWSHDLLDQPSAVSIDGGEARQMRRDSLGRLVEAELAPGLKRHCRYDADGRLTGQAVTRQQERLFLTGYDYDAAGNLVQRRDSQYGSDRYLYDPMGRILQHTDPTGLVRSFVNDPAGDRLRTRVSPGEGEGGRWEAWSRDGEYEGAAYRFDRAGNLVSKTEGPARLDLDWDANQRLVASRRSVAGEGATRVTTYGYDPLGRRLFKETEGRRTWFGWDGDALAFDWVPPPLATVNAVPEPEWQPGPRTVTGRLTQPTLPPLPAVSREFVNQPESFEPAAMLVDGAGQPGQVLHYVNDPNGCPVRLVDDAGEVRWGASYTAWGRVDRLHVSEVDNPIRLQGQYEDAETGLHYNRHRYFSTELGTFISCDPLGLAAGTNLCSLGPNCLKWVDPLGLACTAGKNFKDHFIRHKGLLEGLLGKKYSPWKKGGGDEFLADLDKLIADGRLVHAGDGTLKLGQPVVHVFRGEGLTAIIKPGGEFVTLLESGKGMDTAIQMVPGTVFPPGTLLP